MNMENQNIPENVIAIRKRDISMAHEAFADLMGKTEKILNTDSNNDGDRIKSFSPSDLEQFSLTKIREACQDSPFNPDEVKLVSGHRFPDIIAERFYGVEVKSTKSDHWTSTGSSILESTRDVNVEDIYMLFGKLGGVRPEFKCRPYDEVLSEIAVTHSPRYLIDMNLSKENTIFSKMGVSYNDFRTSPDCIAVARQYYKDKALRENKLEMPWWITSENVDKGRSFNIRMWNALDAEEKKNLKLLSMILFPEALDPKGGKDKYNQTTLWMCSYKQVIIPNVRDMYSSGGRIQKVNGKLLEKPASKVFYQIVRHANEIKELLNNPSEELISLIRNYNPELLESENLYDSWIDICKGYAEAFDVPLEAWIKSECKFEFSK